MGVSLTRSDAAQVIGLDPRSLAAFRIGMASLLLVDLAIRFRDLEAMYTDRGFLTVEAAMGYFQDVRWSLHWLSGSAGLQILLFALAAVFAMLLLVGYRTRIAIVVSWILLCSLHARNPLILNRGDAMFRMMLFWAMFLPLGQAWSLDARRALAIRRPVDKPLVSIASAAIILQLCIIYWYTGFTKFNEVWLGFDPGRPLATFTDPSGAGGFQLGGDALAYVCMLDMYARPLAETLRQFPAILRAASLGTVVLELGGPVLLLVPWGTRYLRLFVIGSFVGLHAGIELTLHIGLFSWVSIVAWLLLLPPDFWSNGWSSRCAGWFRARSRSASEAAAEHDAADRTVAGSFGFARFISSGLCLSFLLINTWLNVSTMIWEDRGHALQAPFRPVASLAMIHYYWSMFDRPPAVDAWYVYRGSLRDGDVVDVFRDGAPLALEKPARYSAEFPNHRWRKLHMQLLDEAFAPYRQPVAEYFARDWNERHGAGRQLLSLEMLCFRQQINPDRTFGKPVRARFAVVELRRQKSR